MLSVLIVDDDKLTRKGLIASMPWQEHSMRVVGEAANGAAAMEFLKSHEVDLILTDLDMPLMSGMELIRKVMDRHPNIYFVVITIHDNFESIQEALRLGAIDYIAKVQLDRENFSKLLGRIESRVKKLLREQPRTPENRDQTSCCENTIEVVLSMNESADGEFDSSQELVTMGDGIWIVPEEYPRDSARLKLSTSPGMMYMELTGVLGTKFSAIHKQLVNYKKNALFYAYNPENSRVRYDISKLQALSEPASDRDFDEIKEYWVSLAWVKDRSVFQRQTALLEQRRLTVSQLLHIAIAVEHTWNKVYGANEKILVPSSFFCWKEYEEWLTMIFGKTKQLLEMFRFSPHVTEAIFSAKKMIDNEFSSNLHSSNIAGRVHMSRSYFSQCFCDVIGISFGSYLRSVRINKAKELLRNTNYPIQQIAEETGYEDEKYFSYLFKKTVTMLPSEYRKLGNIN